MECPICYECVEGTSTSTTPCGHVFHTTCLGSWLERGTTCPSCRSRLADAPADPHAEPLWMGWFEERHLALTGRIQGVRERFDSIAIRVQQVKAEFDALKAEFDADAAAAAAAQRQRRSEAAKRGAATRAANRAARMACNGQ